MLTRASVTSVLKFSFYISFEETVLFSTSKIRMPPKAVRGRKRAIVEEVQNGCESETKLISQDLIKKKTNNDDIPPKDKNCNGDYDVEALETEEKANKSSDTNVLFDDILKEIGQKSEEKANKSSDTNVLVDDILKEVEHSKEVIRDSNVESQINDLSEKDSNLNTKIAPLKRGREEVNATAEDGEVPTKTVDPLSIVDEDKKESLAKQKKML